MGQPRNFYREKPEKALPTLTKLGIAHYDKDPSCSIKAITFKNLPKAIEYYKRKLRTTDMDVIERRISRGLMREVGGIIERKEAQKYAANRSPSVDDFASDVGKKEDMSIMKSSEYNRS